MQEEYKQSHEEARKIAAEATTRLERENLPFTPDMYELFYCYYSGVNSEVTRSIDIMVSQKFDLTFERCKELHTRLLNSNKMSATLQQAELVVDNTLADVDEMVLNVRNSNEDFSESMDTITHNVANAVNEQDLRQLVVDVLSETQKMMSENQTLEQRLEKSQQTMQSLKDEMERVRKEAYTDALTGIANRKRFDVEVTRLVAEAKENGKSITAVFLDIDHFKSFNDAYGHQIGDQVLRLVARALRDGLKGRDFPCRYGGEEFVILLPETDLDNATKLANVLRETIKSKEIKNRKTGETLSRVTISAGVSLFREDEDIKEWLDRADAALYQAKRKGRDCVVMAG